MKHTQLSLAFASCLFIGNAFAQNFQSFSNEDEQVAQVQTVNFNNIQVRGNVFEQANNPQVPQVQQVSQVPRQNKVNANPAMSNILNNQTAFVPQIPARQRQRNNVRVQRQRVQQNRSRVERVQMQSMNAIASVEVNLVSENVSDGLGVQLPKVNMNIKTPSLGLKSGVSKSHGKFSKNAGYKSKRRYKSRKVTFSRSMQKWFRKNFKGSKRAKAKYSCFKF